MRSISVIALLSFIIWRSNEPLAHFGIKKFRIILDLLGGVGLWAVATVAIHFSWPVLRFAIGQDQYLQILRSAYRVKVVPLGFGDYAMLAVSSFANGLAEEIVMRAYLITRLEELLDSTGLALLLTTVMFTCYHGYQGTAGVMSVAIGGLISGIAYCLFRRLCPIVIAHGLMDFLAYTKIRLF
jgi:membrane protease YdiL (CAAX protease family)